MIKSISKWLLNALPPSWGSPEPELKYRYDFKTGTIKLCMESFRNSKVVQAQVAACMAQSEDQHSVTDISGRKTKSSGRGRRRRRAKSSRRECPTTMHGL